MAKLGYRRFDEMVGQMQMLDRDRAIGHWKANGLDFSKLFAKPDAATREDIFHSAGQDHHLDQVLDRMLIEKAGDALTSKKKVVIESPIKSVNRTTGAMLSGEVAKRFGHKGLPDDTIHVKLNGTAGQSFGAWVAKGVTLELEGEANDYVGKGLSGGRLIVYPPKQATKIVPHESIIVGNTVLYGAIAGECYFRGVAGERFAVRNSGAIAVVEGTGDHGCEYMTGGVVVVIGQTGRNFAAGMSGGMAFVLDDDGLFEKRVNPASVSLEPIDTAADRELLKGLLEEHVARTDSPIAAALLKDWTGALKRFVKVMPDDYARVLAERAAKDEEAAIAGD
jgi:glutamate synthase (NADPH/NADH) large chain